MSSPRSKYDETTREEIREITDNLSKIMKECNTQITHYKREDLHIVDAICRVLSIQSSVLYGYVGNKAAVFTLQVNGIEVDPLNTCQYSNHAGYDICTGPQTQGKDVFNMFDGIIRNRLIHNYTHVLTGYMTNAGCLKNVIAFTSLLKQYCKGTLVVCDPVMGDSGELYVPEEFVSLYKHMLPYADVLTPNQTEIELLTDTYFTDIYSVKTACDKIHALGCSAVVITSLCLSDSTSLNAYLTEIQAPTEYLHIPTGFDTKYYKLRTTSTTTTAATPADANTSTSTSIDVCTCHIDKTHVPERIWNASIRTDPHTHDVTVDLPTTGEYIHIIASEQIDKHSKPRVYYVRIPQYHMYVSGTGDLTSALLTSWLQKGVSLQEAISKTLASVQAVLRATLIMQRYELSLIHAREELCNPTVQVQVIEITDLYK